MANLFGNLFGGRSHLTTDFFNQFQREMDVQAQRAAQVQAAQGSLRAEAQQELNREMTRMAQAQAQGAMRTPDGQPTTGREILERQRGLGAGLRDGMLHIQQNPRSRERESGDFWRQAANGFQPNMFTRWMDIRESEDELQEFLAKCVAYGAKMQRPTNMSVKDLEK